MELRLGTIDQHLFFLQCDSNVHIKLQTRFLVQLDSLPWNDFESTLLRISDSRSS
jgi:hypothetical protein